MVQPKVLSRNTVKALHTSVPVAILGYLLVVCIVHIVCVSITHHARLSTEWESSIVVIAYCDGNSYLRTRPIGSTVTGDLSEHTPRLVRLLFCASFEPLTCQYNEDPVNDGTCNDSSAVGNDGYARCTP